MNVILINCTAETFNKLMEKDDINAINYLKIDTDINTIIKLMSNYKLCYDIENDIYYNIEDLKELIQN